MSQSNGISLAGTIILGLVILGAFIFLLAGDSIAGLGRTDCTTGLGNCEDEEEQELPPATGDEDSDFVVRINKVLVGNIAELKEGQQNSISFVAPEGRKCQAIVLVNEETYVERGKAISVSGDCNEEMFIKVEELKKIEEENKVTMAFVLYKKDAPALYAEEILKEKSKEVSVRII